MTQRHLSKRGRLKLRATQLAALDRQYTERLRDIFSLLPEIVITLTIPEDRRKQFLYELAMDGLARKIIVAAGRYSAFDEIAEHERPLMHLALHSAGTEVRVHVYRILLQDYALLRDLTRYASAERGQHVTLITNGPLPEGKRLDEFITYMQSDIKHHELKTLHEAAMQLHSATQT